MIDPIEFIVTEEGGSRLTVSPKAIDLFFSYTYHPCQQFAYVMLSSLQIVPVMNNIMQSDQQLTAAEKVAQEAESKKREAELKAEMEKKAREEMEEKLRLSLQEAIREFEEQE